MIAEELQPIADIFFLNIGTQTVTDAERKEKISIQSRNFFYCVNMQHLNDSESRIGANGEDNTANNVNFDKQMQGNQEYMDSLNVQILPTPKKGHA